MHYERMHDGKGHQLHPWLKTDLLYLRYKNKAVVHLRKPVYHQPKKYTRILTVKSTRKVQWHEVPEPTSKQDPATGNPFQS